MSEAGNKSVSQLTAERAAQLRILSRLYGFTAGLMLTGLLVIAAMLMVVTQYFRAGEAARQSYVATGAHLNNFARLQVALTVSSRNRAFALIAADAEAQRRYTALTHEGERQALQMIDEFTQRAAAPEEQQLFKRLRADFVAVQHFTERMLADKSQTDLQTLAGRYITEGGPISESIRDDLRRVSEYYQREFQERLREWQAQSNRAFWHMCALLGGVLLIAAAVILKLHQRRIREAQQSEQLLRDVFESISEPIFVLSEDRRVRIWNTASRIRMGRQHEEVAGQLFDEAFPALRGSELARAIATVNVASGPWVVPQTTLNDLQGDIEYEVRVFPFRRGLTVYARDITRQKKAEQAIRRSEELFRAMFAGSPLPMFVCDLKTLEFLEVNEQFVSAYGWSRQELLQMRLTDIRPPEDIPGLFKRLSNPDRSAPDVTESRHCLHNGEVIDVRIFASLLEYQGRQAAVIVAQDITARRRTESVLRLKEAQLQEARQFTEQVISGAGEGIVVSDCWMRALLWNRKMEELTDLPATRALGRHARDNFPGLLMPELERCHLRALQGEIVTSPDFLLHSSRAGDYWLSATFAPNRTSAGEIIGTIATVRDVTSRRQAEESGRQGEQRLRESEEKYRQLCERAPDVVIIIDEKSCIQYANSSLADIFGWQPAEVIGRNISLLQPEQESHRHAEGLRRIFTTDERRQNWHSFQALARHRDGHEFPVEMAFSDLHINGQRWITGFIRDLTARQSRAARAQSEAAGASARLAETV